MKKTWKPTEQKPINYRLCKLDLGEKQVCGWWTGLCWDGYYYRGEDVKQWRYMK